MTTLALGMALAILPPAAASAPSTATVQIGGTIPATVSVVAANDSQSAANFKSLIVGNNTVNTITPLLFKMRSNVPYRLTARVTSITGALVDGVGGDGISLKTGDIGFGVQSLLKSGASVIGGTTSRNDRIAAGFDVTAGWPAVTAGQTPAFLKTIRDLTVNDTEILAGDRISARGDNSSNDNFLLLGIGMAVLPQYVDVGPFGAVLTLTIAPAGL